MLTLQDKLDRIIIEAREEFFSRGATMVGDAEVLGILLATHFKWDGGACFETLTHALEDSNFHRVNRALQETWKTIEGGAQ
jgi:DNA repair protein RadC